MSGAIGLALFCGAAQLHSGATLTTSAAGGESPTSIISVSVPTFISRAAPTLTIRRENHLSTLNTSYTPQVTWRVPVPGNSNRPFLLHRGTLNYQEALTRRLATTLNLSGSTGQADYQTSQLVFGASQSALAATGRPHTTVGQGTANLTWLLTRRWQLNWNLQANYSDIYGGFQTRSTRKAALLGMSGNYKHTRQTNYTLGASAGFQSLTTANYFTSRAQAGVAHQFTKQTNGGVTAGVMVLHLLEGVNLVQTPPISPFMSANLAINTPQSREYRWNHSFGLSLSPTADAVLEALLPRLTLNASTNVRNVPGQWQMRVAASASSNLTQNPLPGHPIESSAGASATFSWQVVEDHLLSANLTTSVRGPHLTVELPQQQLELLAGVSYRWQLFDEQLAP